MKKQRVTLHFDVGAAGFGFGRELRFRRTVRDTDAARSLIRRVRTGVFRAPLRGGVIVIPGTRLLAAYVRDAA